MSPDRLQRAERLLGSAGLRRTGPRVAVLKVLLGAAGPLSHEQIAADLRPAAPNKTTIYRVLDSLVEKGLVHRVFLPDRTQHFELGHNCSEHQCHPHFTCTECGQTSCLTELSVPMAASPHKGFIIRHQRVQLEGTCPDCTVRRRQSS